MHVPRRIVLCLVLLAALGACSGATTSESEPSDATYSTWQHYLGDPTRSHYSSLDQINTSSVVRLEQAWMYNSGDADPQNTSQIQCSPLVVDSILYGTNPKLKLFAVHAGTGREIWTFDPGDARTSAGGVNRGAMFWEDGTDRRIYYTAGFHLVALDALTGRLVPTFGEGGKVDLREGLDRDPEALSVLATTPGAVFDDLIILGSRVLESPGSAPGDIRAFDVRTGEIRWTFHTIPRPGEFGYDTWPPAAYTYIGGANNWAGMAVDEERGIAFIPTGSAAFDFYGGNRTGKNLFANTLLALDARSGKRIWHYQIVRHDLWDRDLPAPPNLVTVERDGKSVPAVAQVTKSGHVFVFDRVSGTPLFPIEEHAVPPSDLPGEEAWPTQPLPSKPEPFARQRFTADRINHVSGRSQARLNDMARAGDTTLGLSIRETLGTLRSDGVFIPPSLQGNIMLPGFDGGAEWGGAGYDPTTGILYVNANEMPWIFRMKPIASEGGEALYAVHCARCHGGEREGQSGVYPALKEMQLSRDSVKSVLVEGKGAMPSFAHLAEEDVEALTAFLFGEASTQRRRPVPEGARVPFALETFGRFLDEDGYPAIEPPWGTLNAIDLSTGEYVFRVPLGEFEELTERGIPSTGTENYGGPVVTAGGLVFIAASKDERLHAYDKQTGELLWEAPLPAGGYATPITYEIGGRQYVVIACGGGKMGTKSGDAYVAFALPQ